MADDDKVSLLVEVLKSREAKRQLDEINNKIDQMSDTQRDAALSAAQSSDHQREALGRLSTTYTEMNARLEIFNRLLGFARQAVDAYARAIQNVAERSSIIRRETSALTEEIERLNVSFAQGVTEGGRLTRVLRNLNESADDAGSSANLLGRAFDFLAGRALESVTSIEGAIDSLSRFGGVFASPAVQAAFQIYRTLGGPGEEAAAAGMSREDLERLAGAYGEAKAGMSPEAQGAEWARRRLAAGVNVGTMTPERRAEILGRRGAGGGGDPLAALEAAARRWQEFKREWEADDFWGQQVRDFSDAWARAADVAIDEQEGVSDQLEQMRSADHVAALERTWAEVDARREAADRIMEFERLIAERRRNETQASIQDFQQYAGAVNTVAGAVGNVFGYLAENEEEGSEAAKKYGAIQGGIMAGIAFVQSAIEYAAAIASAAKEDYPGMAQHIAAGIAYDVAGGLALANLGGSAKSAGSTGTATRSYVPEHVGTDTAEGGGGTTILIQTMGLDNARNAHMMNQAQRRARRSGVDMPMVPAGDAQ